MKKKFTQKAMVPFFLYRDGHAHGRKDSKHPIDTSAPAIQVQGSQKTHQYQHLHEKIVTEKL